MSILLVDADPLSLRVLDFSLRGAGFSVTVATDAAAALATLHASVPDLVVVDTRMPGSDGFVLVRAIRERVGRADLPAIFLATADRADERARASELGIQDILVKPVFVRELVPRIQLLLASRFQQIVASEVSIAEGRPLTGTTHEVALVDLLQSLEATRTTGVVHVHHEGQDARIYLRDGNVVDAELGRSRGSDVIVRILMWHPASFRVEPGPVDNDDLLECSTHALLMRVIDRLDGLTPTPAPAEIAFDTPAPAASDAREVPSTIPWTRDAGSDAAQSEEVDLLVDGVPRASTRTFRRLGLIASGLGATALIAVGFASMHSQRAQAIELSGTEVSTSAATVGPVPNPLQAANPDGTPTVEGAPTPSPTAGATDETPPLGADFLATALPGSSASPAASAPDPRETALDVRAELHAKSALVREAHRALLKGDTTHAISLAQQATTANSGDADAWLTLAAARKASGDSAGARDAYRKCVTTARTFGVMSCRVLAAKAE
jgi:DNA-binding response OmpR family regulator